MTNRFTRVPAAPSEVAVCTLRCRFVQARIAPPGPAPTPATPVGGSAEETEEGTEDGDGTPALGPAWAEPEAVPEAVKLQADALTATAPATSSVRARDEPIIISTP